MSSPPPWVRDGHFSLCSPTNSLDTAQPPTPSLECTRSAISSVESSNQVQLFPLVDRQTAHLHIASQSCSSSVPDKASLAKNQGQVMRSPKDHWLILPPEFENAQSTNVSKGQSKGQTDSRNGDRSSTEPQETKIETEFPVNNTSPRIKHISVSDGPSCSPKVCDSSKEDKNNLNLSEEKFTKDLKEKESLKVEDPGNSDEVSPGQELLKLSDSFTERYIIDKNDGLPHIMPQMSPSGAQNPSSHPVTLMESDSEDSDSSSRPLSHDFSCASTVSLNELLEKELDEMETPGDEDFSVNSLPIYIMEGISIDDLEDFADIGDPKQIYDQCLVQRRFEIKDGVLVARSVPREDAVAKQQSNDITNCGSHEEKGTPSPERPNSLKLDQGRSRCSGCSHSSDNECNKLQMVTHSDTGDLLVKEEIKNPTKGSPPKVLPKPNKKCTVSGMDKCKSGAIPKVTNSGDVTPIMVGSNHSNSSSSPDSAMQGSFTSTSSSDVCGTVEKVASRGDDGYVSNSTVSTSLNDLHKDLTGIDGKFSWTPSVETRSTLSTPLSEETSLVSRSELSSSVRERRETQGSSVSHSSVGSSSLGKVKDMRAYFEQRVEQLTQEVSTAVNRDVIPQVPNCIKIERKMSESDESTTVMLSSCDSESMSCSFIIQKTGNSWESSDMSNSQKTLTPQDSEAKSPLTVCQGSVKPRYKSSQCLINSDDRLLLQKMNLKTKRILKRSLSYSGFSQGSLLGYPGYLKSLHSQVVRAYCLAASLTV